MNRLHQITVFVLLIIIVGCKGNKTSDNYTYDKIPELKAPIVLYPNQNTIYTQNYITDLSILDSVQFSMPKYFSISPDLQEIYLDIDFDSIKPLTELKFWIEGYCYSVLCKKAPLTKATFTTEVIKNNTFNKVTLTGDFNNWNTDELPMIYQGYSWSHYLYLEPGRYEYRIVGDGKYNLSSMKVKDSVKNEAGGYNYIKKIPDKSDKAPSISIKSIEEDEICITSTQVLVEYFIFWQNMRLPLDLKKVEGYNYYFSTPPVAEKINTSHIRVYGYNKNGISNELVIPLVHGKAVNTATALNSSFPHSNIMLASDMVEPSVEILDSMISKHIFSKLGINSLCISELPYTNDYIPTKSLGKTGNKTSSLMPFIEMRKSDKNTTSFEKLNQECTKSGITAYYVKNFGETYFNRKLNYIANSIFANDTLSFDGLAQAMRYSSRTFGDLHLLGNLVEDPLTQGFHGQIYNIGSDSAIATAQQRGEYINKKWMQYIAFQFTIPGIPCLLLGSKTESLCSALNDIEQSNLSPTEKEQLLVFLKLLQIRKNNIALFYGEIKILECNKSYLIYQRKYLNNIVIVAFNKTPFTQMLGVNLTDIQSSTRFSNHFASLIKQEDFYVRMEIPAYSFEILTSKNK
ncbi:MAG: hypothetical protein KBB11_07500 [Bacteroidales bacterium]|nr:hypothetical protein [Bacteroidales bacterium]HOY39930.1 hypothetical protein [Bacteroidales bacterium]HQP03673.1 hypothetical protein [Bacteroidales bacterium]